MFLDLKLAVWEILRLKYVLRYPGNKSMMDMTYYRVISYLSLEDSFISFNILYCGENNKTHLHKLNFHLLFYQKNFTFFPTKVFKIRTESFC